MVQPSYPKTVELPHSGPSSSGTRADPGANPVSPDMAPPDGTSPDAHANESNRDQAERPDTKAVNKGSIIRKELDDGPGGPHHA
ncbi:MAG: hypothetical protein EOP07_07205 [Proteobacteria bacterium]|nr:MAG: hypothetical protein EOP07_07205 [Pseudomonadota bacterium]